MSQILDDAQAICEYLTTPTAIRIRVSPVRTQSGEMIANQPEGELMQLHDNEQVDYTIVAVDAKGFTVDGETFSATSSDDTVVAVNQNGATFTAVAGNPGSVIVTFTDGTLTATEAIDVIPGSVAALQITPGTPTPQA